MWNACTFVCIFVYIYLSLYCTLNMLMYICVYIYMYKTEYTYIYHIYKHGTEQKCISTYTKTTRTIFFAKNKQNTIVPSSKQKDFHGTCCYCIAYGNIEIHAVTFLFFFKFVYDIILFENEVYILINIVTRFHDTMGT